MKLEIWTFLPAGRNFTVKILNFIGWFRLKDKLLQQKNDTGLSCPDTEGPWNVWGDSDSWFPIQPRKKSANFVPASHRVEISNLMGWFFLNVTLVEPKTLAWVSCYDSERPWKVWGESDCRFLIEPRKKSVNFFPASHRVEIWNFMVCFFLKDTLVMPKTLAGVSCYDTERPWKVLGESDWRFPIQPRKKSVNFVPASDRVEIWNFMVCFFLKRTLLVPKTLAGVSSYDTEESWQVWGKSDCWFPIEPRKKSGNFDPASHRVEIWNFMVCFFLKDTLVMPKTLAGVSCYDTERPWKVLGESDWRFPIQPRKKSVNFVPASDRVEIWNFMVCFFLKRTLLVPKTLAGVSSYDTERSWQVWGKSDSWFPIEPRKKSGSFVPASHRVEISNLMGLVFLKRILVEPKTLAEVLSYQTERPWEVLGESGYWFPIQPWKKMWISFQQARGSKFQISWCAFS